MMIQLSGTSTHFGSKKLGLPKSYQSVKLKFLSQILTQTKYAK